MLQIIQNQKNGKIIVDELPKPSLPSEGVIVQNVCSIISSGTERTSVLTAQSSLLEKARSRPDLVKQVLDNIEREGIVSTYFKVRDRLNNYKELGYSSAGIVLESSAAEFKQGDRVACGGTAHHAEIISISRNLAVKIPDNVSFEDAAFTTLGAISMQAIRQLNPQIGEYTAVIGLGLIGLITVQLLNACGCRVIGIDKNEKNFTTAFECGCSYCFKSNPELVQNIEKITYGRKADNVIITAGTLSNEPIETASKIIRKKSKIIITGRVGMEIPYNAAYLNELEFKMSCSYGPGRYDRNYEEKGIDYPLEYVRWTEKRNMEAVLDLLSQNKISFKRFITHRFSIERALEAYEIIINNTIKNSVILFSYSNERKDDKKIIAAKKEKKKYDPDCKIGMIGAGNFSRNYIIPNLKKHGAELVGVCTRKPVNARSAAKEGGFTFFTSDPLEIINDKLINLVVICTRHDSHAEYIIEALNAGKNVYTEKPLCINVGELSNIIEAYRKADGRKLMVGYNRRYSKALTIIKDFFSDADEPFLVNYRINAGFIPKESWYQSPEQGGRIIGESGHFIDTINYITGDLPDKVYAKLLPDKFNKYNNDNVSAALTYIKGSIGNLTYFASGSPKMSKELIEINCGGKSAVLNNFKELTLFDTGRKKTYNTKGDKGHENEIKNLIKLMNEEGEIIPYESIITTSLTTFMIMDSINNGFEVKIDADAIIN